MTKAMVKPTGRIEPKPIITGFTQSGDLLDSFDCWTFVWLVISVDPFVVVKIVFPLSVLSGDVNGVVLSFFDVELSADVAVILCEVDELSKDSVASVFFWR